MRRQLFILVLVMKLIGLPAGLSAQQVSAQPKPSLGIAGADAAKTVSIQVDSAHLDQRLRIDSLNAVSAPDVEVRLSPLVGAKQKWVQPRWLCWSNDEQKTKCSMNSACTKVTIAGLKEAWCRVTAFLPDADTYNGRIDLIYNDVRDSYKLTITRGPDETLQVRGIDNATEYATESSLFELTTGISSSSLRAVPGVHLIVYDLIGTPAVTPSVVLNGQSGTSATVAVPGNGEIPLKLSMNLPVPGTYKGALELVHGGKRDRYTFNVKRVEAKAPVTIRPIDAVSADTSTSGVVRLRVILEGTRTGLVTLDLPNIAALSRKQSNKVSEQALFSSIKFKEISPEKDLTAGSSVMLDGRTPKQLQVEITGLESGEYSGLFTVGTKDLAAQECAFSIYVRRTWWIAGLWIGLGVFLSWRLRSWVLKGRPRLAAQRQLSQLAVDINATFPEVKDATPAEKRVLNDFSGRVADLYGEWDRGTATGTADTTDKLIKEITGKLSAFRLWVNLRRRFDAVQTAFPTLPQLRQRLAEFETRFRNHGEDANLATAITQLGTDLTGAVSALLVSRIQALRTDIQAVEVTELGKPYASQLEADLLPHLTQAEQLAALPDRFNEAVAKLENVRLTYCRTLADALSMQIPAATPDPRISQAEWDSVVTTVGQAAEKARLATSADVAADAYGQAFSVYMNRVLGAMEVRVRAAPEKISATRFSAEDQKVLNDEVEAARKLAGLCRTQVANHEFTAATKTFEQMRDTVLEVAGKVKSGGQNMGYDVAVVTTQAVTGAGTAAVFERRPMAGAVESISEPPARIILSVTEIDNRIRRNETIFAMVVGVISILVGVKLLWVPSPTWGDWADYVTALLWGLGLHQVSGAALGQFDWGTMLGKWSGAGGGANVPG